MLKSLVASWMMTNYNKVINCKKNSYLNLTLDQFHKLPLT